MARRDLQDIKEEVRARADIVGIIGRYTHLKRSGKGFTGLCPFHNDKKPSFHVSPTFGSYKCWSCGESGDVYTFLQKKENLTFVEALETLAKQVGVEFERTGYSPERVSERQEMFDLNSLAVEYFREGFSRSDEARAYLAGRSILKETQDRFDIGFAPPDWDGLANYLRRRGANLPMAIKIGLIRERKSSDGYTDYYRNRVMFPIHDRTGSVAGFGGRAMGEEQPKYINSPQSDIFNKSALLYGLYFARNSIGPKTPPVFVEGYTDVVTTHQAGFTQCVATLGTAMTEDHARMLVRLNRKVILCYDSDSAGTNATLKGAAIWENMDVDGAELMVARLPSGDDPDSLLKRGDTSGFQLALDNAVPRVDFEIELVMSRIDTTSNTGRDQALGEIIPILGTVRGSTSTDRYVQKIARLHPMYNFNPTRAMESILADIRAYKQHTKGGTTGRSRGHAAIEGQNGAPLREQAPPPYFRRDPSRQNQFYPGTSNWVQSQGSQSGWSGSTGRGADSWKGRRFERQGPPSDPTPPSLDLPEHSAAEKAEITLLRGLFTAEWRGLILQHTDAASLVTERGRELAHWILATPPDADGEINPVEVVRTIERESGPISHDTQDVNNDNLLPVEDNESSSVNHSAKMSDFVRNLVEDSASILSNEPLNEANIMGCIRRLQEHRNSRQRRELTEMLGRDDLTQQQRTNCMHDLMELMRAQRGSAPGS